MFIFLKTGLRTSTANNRQAFFNLLRWATYLCTFGSVINWEKFSLKMSRCFLLNLSRRQTLPKTFSNWVTELKQAKQIVQTKLCKKINYFFDSEFWQEVLEDLTWMWNALSTISLYVTVHDSPLITAIWLKNKPRKKISL